MGEPGKYGCLGYTCATITGDSFENVCAFIGHDASERPFSVKEALGYLFSKGYYLCTNANFTKPILADDTVEGDISGTPEIPPATLKKLKVLATAFEKSVSAVLLSAVNDYLEKHKGLLPEESRRIERYTGLPGAEIRRPGKRLIAFQVPVPIGQKALVNVLSSDEKAGHAVFWDGEYIHDCNYDAPRLLSNYTVLTFYPIVEL